MRGCAALAGTLAAIVIAGAMPATASALAAPSPCGQAVHARPDIRHVIIIVMENRSSTQVIGHAPFMTTLAHRCGLATNYHAITHPSLPNYLAMTSGSTQGVTDDDGPGSHRIGGPSIFSQLGTRWQALEESMPRACAPANSGQYAVRHNPATYYTGIRGPCRAQDVPLRGAHVTAAFTFVTPNLCHDMHSCPVQDGDRWLAAWLPRLLRTPGYRSGSTVVFITWDEDDGAAHQHIPTLVVSPETRPGTRSATAFDHYSMLATTEDLLGVPRLGAAAQATSMSGAFGLG
jgi:hypothetical protein